MDILSKLGSLFLCLLKKIGKSGRSIKLNQKAGDNANMSQIGQIKINNCNEDGKQEI